MYRTFKIPQLAFLGAGKLAETLTKGFIAAGALQINQIWASAPNYTSVMKLGCKTTTDNVKLVKENKTIALSVKPQVLPKVLREISPHITPDHLLLSFAAGNGWFILLGDDGNYNYFVSTMRNNTLFLYFLKLLLAKKRFKSYFVR